MICDNGVMICDNDVIMCDDLNFCNKQYSKGFQPFLGLVIITLFHSPRPVITGNKPDEDLSW
jgi:hypothetical protein